LTEPYSSSHRFYLQGETMAKLIYLLPLLLGVVACGAQPEPIQNVSDIVDPTLTAITENHPQVLTPQTSLTMTTIPPIIPSITLTITPPPIVPQADGCPTEAADLKLLMNAEDGYCLLYPAEHTAIPPRFIVINPTDALGGDKLGDAWVGIIVEAAANRTAAQVADSEIAKWGGGSNITRIEILVDGMQAVVVDGLPGPDPLRNVFIVSNDRLYRFYFMPWAKNANESTPIEKLYSTVIDTIHFLPSTQVLSTTTPP
jgi:hypothetical protein